MNLPPGSLSMCAGDFVEVYSTPDNAEAFDAIVTCFFIDTAHNIVRRARVLRVVHRGLLPSLQIPLIEKHQCVCIDPDLATMRVCFALFFPPRSYLETIWRALRPGGFWINHGPLLWHWADAHTYLNTAELSIEVPLESVLRCAASMGFMCACFRRAPLLLSLAWRSTARAPTLAMRLLAGCNLVFHLSATRHADWRSARAASARTPQTAAA